MSIHLTLADKRAIGEHLETLKASIAAASSAADTQELRQHLEALWGQTSRAIALVRQAEDRAREAAIQQFENA